jgi:hypothetical protein
MRFLMDFWTLRKPGYVGETSSQTCSERPGFRFHKLPPSALVISISRTLRTEQYDLSAVLKNRIIYNPQSGKLIEKNRAAVSDSEES